MKLFYVKVDVCVYCVSVVFAFSTDKEEFNVNTCKSH